MIKNERLHLYFKEKCHEVYIYIYIYIYLYIYIYIIAWALKIQSSSNKIELFYLWLTFTITYQLISILIPDFLFSYYQNGLVYHYVNYARIYRLWIRFWICFWPYTRKQRSEKTRIPAYFTLCKRNKENSSHTQE